MQNFREKRFLGRPEQAAELAKEMLPLLPSGAGIRVLDLGCGFGDLAIAIKALRPDAEVTGLDFSQSNVAAAKARTNAVAFYCGDYMEWRGAPFDAIISDSVLHLVDATPEQLATKLRHDISPGGTLIATVPSNTIRNKTLRMMRFAYRLTPKLTDRFLGAIAGAIYPTIPKDIIADRLPYMRFVPPLFGADVLSAFKTGGFDLLHAQPLPRPSVAKLDHFMGVWRRN